jgi:hypothetical protein
MCSQLGLALDKFPRPVIRRHLSKNCQTSNASSGGHVIADVFPVVGGRENILANATCNG